MSYIPLSWSISLDRCLIFPVYSLIHLTIRALVKTISAHFLFRFLTLETTNDMKININNIRFWHLTQFAILLTCLNFNSHSPVWLTTFPTCHSQEQNQLICSPPSFLLFTSPSIQSRVNFFYHKKSTTAIIYISILEFPIIPSSVAIVVPVVVVAVC